MPLFTTTPNKIRNPINVFAFKRLLPVTNNAINEPVAAKGIEKRITKGVVTDSNTIARIININKNAARIRNLKSPN